MTTLLLALALLTLASDPSSPSGSGPHGEESWTRFRGSQGDGVLAERRFPSTWGPETNLAWSVEVPGSGWSSPIAVGQRVFVTSAVDPDGKGPVGMDEGVADMSTFGGGGKPESELTFRLTCLDLGDGSVTWTRDVGARVPEYGVHGSNTFATESPASDGQRVFVTFGALGELVCYDLEGEEQWRVETGVFPTGNDFGWGISLVVHDGLVYLQNDNEEASFLAAFDTGSGEERWRAERAEGSSWGTPVLWSTGERTSLVACGPDTVIGYDAATGAEHWRVQGIGGSFSSSPTFDDERVYFGNSGPMSRGPLMAVPASAKGVMDLRAEGELPIAWREDRAGPGFSSPLAHDGLVYVLGSSGVMACHDAATGELVWRERMPDTVQVVASPWLADDELYVMDEAGTTVVLRAGPEFEVLRTNRLAGLYWGTPSVAGDALLLREARRLHCIRE